MPFDMFYVDCIQGIVDAILSSCHVKKRTDVYRRPSSVKQGDSLSVGPQE